MKFTLFTLTVAGLAAATLDGVPSCVKPCIEKALADVGCTGSSQELANCACKPEVQSKLLSPVTQCASENKCQPADLLTAQKVSMEQCKALTGGAGAGAKTSPLTTTGTHSLAPPTGTPTASANSTSGSKNGSATSTGAQPTSTNGAAVMGPAVGALVALFAALVAL
ncbi:hypothetical protein E4U42_003411 [Claviceps africana]|uniref:CFEM domain-containing protein n=1 Tax=Claviceps africana TaxID=83212 RepID=A0A8K0NIW2_9HYPO|nr:hypothetical protein E4U42_003411 [Claviceps africana]